MCGIYTCRHHFLFSSLWHSPDERCLSMQLFSCRPSCCEASTWGYVSPTLSAHLMAECACVFREVAASQRNLPHSLNSFLGNLLWKNPGKSKAQDWHHFLQLLHPYFLLPHICPSLPYCNLLSHGNAPLTDLYLLQTHPCMGSPCAFVLFHRASTEPGWGISVCFPMQP